MSWRKIVIIMLTIVLIVLVPITASAQEPCPGNRVVNSSFEDGAHSDGNGLPASSMIANGWAAWSVWGYSATSRQAEFDMEDIRRLDHYSTYRAHSGNTSQKFSTAWGTHNAGLYQRIAVPKGSTVTFSAWVQIFTGEKAGNWNGEPISDLNQPGNYRVYVGIDPFGDEPGMVGSPPSTRVVWSAPIIDRDTRRYDSKNQPYDAWVQLEVTTKAEADYVTVFIRGEPEFPVRHNVSYWDDACLTFVPPKPVPTATPLYTNTPKLTQTAKATPLPTETALPTATPQPTVTQRPTQLPTVLPTSTPAPTNTTLPTNTPTQTRVPASTSAGSTDNPFLLLIFAALWLSAAGYLGWSLYQKRSSAPQKPVD
jgi:hypothetical protein